MTRSRKRRGTRPRTRQVNARRHAVELRGVRMSDRSMVRRLRYLPRSFSRSAARSLGRDSGSARDPGSIGEEKAALCTDDALRWVSRHRVAGSGRLESPLSIRIIAGRADAAAAAGVSETVGPWVSIVSRPFSSSVYVLELERSPSIARALREMVLLPSATPARPQALSER